MPTADDNAAMETYKSIIEEALLRVHSIDAMLRKSPGLRPTFIREYCFLQLRLLCELIALGCLVCHGDIPASKTKAFQKAWVPGEILKKLQDLHPDFYPVPFVMEDTPSGHHLGDYKDEYLTKDDLLALWSRSGDILHRGNLRKLLKVKMLETLRSDDIIKWNQKILNLLQHHRVSRSGNNFHFLVNVNHPVLTPDTAMFTVQVAIAESPKK
ncbi:hypothetical protein [Phenylobacterium sp.]|uniref:hypothetical protein n=1 Tax=Phenylobacterium sp. TaxID=1871053 RepID=UPI00286D30A9|nr:hypothetical protein [Phenylobacterium sp.]